MLTKLHHAEMKNYGCRNEKLVLPISFGHNLLTYNLSNGKLLLSLNNSITPTGLYTFLKDWLLENALHEIKFPKEQFLTTNKLWESVIL